MDEEIQKSNVVITEVGPQKKPKEAKWIVVAREIVGALFWLFLIIKIFFYDIDSLVLTSIDPQFNVILRYKFFIFIGVTALLWLILGNKRFAKLFFTILFFPWILLFWRVPRIFWKSKSWIGVFSSIGIAFTFFSSLKTNFVIFTILSLSILAIAVSDSQLLLIVAIVFLFFYLLYHYFKKIKYAFSPSHIFTIQTEVINKYWNKIKDYFRLTDDIKHANLDSMNSTQKEKWCNNLQYLLIVNRLFFFITSKLKRFQKSRLNIAYYFASLFFTIIITVLIFSLQFVATYKLDSNSFNSAPKGNFFFFMYYSFNTLFNSSVSNFYPISDFARFMESSEKLFSFVLLAILFFLFTSIIKDKHNDEISEVIGSMTKKGHELEGLLTVEYKMNLAQAIDLLNKIKGNLLQVIYYFANNIDNESAEASVHSDQTAVD